MSRPMISDEIRAKVDEAERRLDDGTRWKSLPWDEDGAPPFMKQEVADLIVSVVNRERAQIEHARDVLGRHPRTDDPKHGSICETCRCGCDEFCQTGAIWPCPEILSLAKAWQVEP